MTALAREDTLDWTDRVLDLDVGAVAHGGHCVARVRVDDGRERVVFVRHALPGERVRAVVTEDGGGAFCRADAIAVLDPAPGRVEPPCPWARAGGCGGCDWQHADGPTQRALKTAVLREQLQRLAGVERDVTVEELPGGLLGWRHRVRLAIDDEGRAGLRAHRSHDVLPIADCPLVPPGELPPVLEQRFPARDEVEVAIDADGVRHLHPVGSRVKRPGGRATGGRARVAPVGRHVLAGPPRAGADAGGGGGGVGAGPGGRARLGPLRRCRAVRGRPGGAGGAGRRGAGGGVGAAGRGRRARRTGPPRAGPLDGGPRRARAGVAAGPPGRRGGRPAPPRPRPRDVAALCDRAPGRVVHVACDPAALARDVALFAAQGYDLAALRAFDAFPMTHHMECVALFQR